MSLLGRYLYGAHGRLYWFFLNLFGYEHVLVYGKTLDKQIVGFFRTLDEAIAARTQDAKSKERPIQYYTIASPLEKGAR